MDSLRNNVDDFLADVCKVDPDSLNKDEKESISKVLEERISLYCVIQREMMDLVSNTLVGKDWIRESDPMEMKEEFGKIMEKYENDMMFPTVPLPIILEKKENKKDEFGKIMEKYENDMMFPTVNEPLPAILEKKENKKEKDVQPKCNVRVVDRYDGTFREIRMNIIIEYTSDLVVTALGYVKYENDSEILPLTQEHIDYCKNAFIHVK